GWDDGVVPDRFSTTYRLDRLAVLPLIGLHVVAAGLATILAFVVWAPLGILVVLLLLHALRLAFFRPAVAITDADGVRLGGQFTVKPVRFEWSDVEDVSLERRALLFDRGDAGTLSFPLAYVGPQADALVRDVYDRLNTANGYRRFDPDAA
ncbi:MAG: hypothetical protein ABWX74_16875, partial [Aeromicrobium sp.]